MQEINGQWIMSGVDIDSPDCLHSVDELAECIEKVGFLPLFACQIPGFSVEEHTYPSFWWSGDKAVDPWEWRAIIAESGKIAYGKFFDNKAGFISKKYFPYFANLRRDGYDFDALWDDGKASLRQKKIMDLFDMNTRLFSFEIKQAAGFGKGKEKNFEGTLTGLQMSTYLCMRDFKKKRNKAGREYGWDVAIYALSEQLFGYKHVTKAYKESPEESYKTIEKQFKKYFGDADERAIEKMIRGKISRDKVIGGK